MNHDSIEKTIVAMHAFFAEWFAGKIPKTDLAGFESYMHPNFSIINPDGSGNTREGVMKQMRDSYGKISDFIVETKDFTMIAGEENLAVASYTEVQRWSEGSNQRRSTMVFVPQADSAHDWVWLHAHETWLDTAADSEK